MSLRVILVLLASLAGCVALAAAPALGAEPDAVAASDADASADPDATAAQDETTTEEESGNSVDSGCADYSTQEEAQQALDEDDTDPLNLDPDDNGIACEDLPSESDPAGGVATGGGGTADVPGPPTVVPAGLVMLALLGAAGALSLLGRRRAHRR